MAAALRARSLSGTATQRLLDAPEAAHATEAQRTTTALWRTLLRSSPSTPGRVVSPRAFWRWLRGTCPEFANTRPHDATEFLALWRQRLRVPRHAAAPPADANQEPPEGDDADPTPWDKWHDEATMGVVTHIRCDHCRVASDNAANPTREREGLLLATIKPDGKYAGVADAIRQNRADEAPVPDWQCRSADCRRRGGNKWHTYDTMPEVLVVQLNRYHPRNGARRSNAHVPVAAELDLAAYYSPRRRSAAGPPGRRSSTKYRLRAAVCHSGASTRDGHYTTWVRDRPEAASGNAENPAAWTLCDDSRVRRSPDAVQAEAMLARDAYLVFYERLPEAAPAPTEAGGDDEDPAPDEHRPTPNRTEPEDIEMEDAEEVAAETCAGWRDPAPKV